MYLPEAADKNPLVVLRQLLFFGGNREFCFIPMIRTEQHGDGEICKPLNHFKLSGLGVIFFFNSL